MYRRREPQKSVLHKVIRENVATFFAEVEEAGVRLPKTVYDEFHDFIACGDPCRGFLRGECRECGRALLIPFSCKCRTACASCGAKRMAALGAHLVDRVLPLDVPVKHWVLTLPFQLRYHVANDRSLLSAVLRIFVDVVFAFYRKRDGKDAQVGSVVGIHRADSALRASPHFHGLFLDGRYVAEDEGKLTFEPARPPNEKELEDITRRIAKRVRRLFIKRGLADEEGLRFDPDAEPSLSEEPVQLGWLTADGDAVISDSSGGGHVVSTAEVAGFSVYSGRAVVDREEVERLARYISRPVVASEQVTQTKDGRVAVRLKKPRRNGETHAFMSPLGFIRRLASLVPPAGMNLLRYHGILAPAAKDRAMVVPVPEIVIDAPPNTVEPDPLPRRPALDWAAALKRVYGIDAFRCACGGRIRIIAVIEAPPVIQKILKHLGLPTESPPVAPARAPPEQLSWFVDS